MYIGLSGDLIIQTNGMEQAVFVSEVKPDYIIHII